MRQMLFAILMLTILTVSGCFKKYDIEPAFYRQYWIEIHPTDSTMRYPTRLTMLWPVNENLGFIGMRFDATTDSAIYEVRDDLVRDTFTLYYKSNVKHQYKDNYGVDFSDFRLGNSTFKKFILIEPSMVSSFYGPLLVIKR